MLEIGKRKADAGNEVIVGLGVRADVMYGAPKPRAFRLGPALELRTVDFKSLEAAAGGGILIPLPGDCPIGLYGLIGAAARKGAPDGMVGIGTVTWGFRGYNYHSWYSYGLNLFFSGRKQIGDEYLVEFTGGVEIDMTFTTLIPLMAIKNYITGGDPFENVENTEE